MKIKLLFYICILAVTVSACGGSSDDKAAGSLADAEKALSAGEYNRAASICDQIGQSADTSSMKWRDCCRMAVVYALAYNHDVESEKSMASAIEYLDRARAEAPDSVESFISVLDNDSHAAIKTVERAMDGFTVSGSDIPDHEEGDIAELSEEDVH